VKEGAWLNARTGAYRWIDEHTRWLQRGENAKTIGLPDSVIQRIKAIPWDFNGEGRRSILLLAMNGGLIRFRGHGSYVTFEGCLSIQEMAGAAQEFMGLYLGPQMDVRINDLARGRAWNGSYGEWTKAKLAPNFPDECARR